MGKKKEPPRKGPRPPKPGIIQSNPDRVRQTEEQIEKKREWQEWEREYHVTDGLRARRYRQAGGPMNAGRPYQGGLPGLGKRQ